MKAMNPIFASRRRAVWCSLALTMLMPVALFAAPAPPAPPTPAAPAFYRVISSFPKYVTTDVEFRDPSGVKWPNFFYGKPATDTGYINLDPAKPAAAFSVLCDKMAQANGDQSRRVLGDLCPAGQAPQVTLAITGMGPLQAATNAKEKNTQVADCTGFLQIGAAKVPVRIAVSFRPHGGKGDEKNIALLVEGKFTLKAGDLGLKSLAPGAPIEGRFGLTAYPPQVAAPTKK